MRVSVSVAKRRDRRHRGVLNPTTRHLVALLGWALLIVGVACAQGSVARTEDLDRLPGAAAPLRQGRVLLQNRRFAQAKQFFRGYLASHATDPQAALGLGDAELGLHQYAVAEQTYRTLLLREPELWQAHKNLVVVEAALGRWEDFDGERKILRLARERGAAGLNSHESDVIDSFAANGERWVVRAYFEPVGRSRALYNFEHFGKDGRIAGYLSLEDARLAVAALTPGDVHIGGGAIPQSNAATSLALNWYTGSAHGTIREYDGEPLYEALRAEVLRWLRSRSTAAIERAR